MNQSGPTEPVGSIEPNPFTKENLNRAPSLHVRRRDHLQVLTIVLPDPATTTGALPIGPPSGPDGPNLTDLVSNYGLTRDNWSLKVDAPAMLRDCGSLRQSGPRPDPRLLRQAALEALTISARTNTPRKTRPEQFPAKWAATTAARGAASA
ncbi:NB-ARC domain containing protein [Dorcoceras hygrometricum]|uniref:NB-ARC domain containing protein n=1 Tax=Dorcoceras hygrometricum TaxID=472368 RepID=A0A2Z7ARS8_9LAMI|nr:NB-ARC domain containing protein [Dorcoceras hygrometricum]